MKILENISLKEYTTFKVGGCAKYFTVIKNIEDLKQAVIFAEQKSLPVFVLGGGSNLLVSDEGVDGLVLKMEIKGTDFASQNPSSRARHYFLTNEVSLKIRSTLAVKRSDPGIIQVTASAGEIWDDLVEQCVEKELYGLENLSYIPGTVGASAVQNIGAYGVEVKDLIDWVEVFDIKTGEIKKLQSKALQFGYRDSIFKKPKGENLIILRVAYNLQKNGELKTDYKDIESSLRENHGRRSFLTVAERRGGATSGSDFRGNPEVTLKDLRKIIIKIRQNKLPDCKKVGTAGSFFKNPVVTKEQLDQLLEKYPELPHHNCGLSESPQFKIPLAYVLDKILGLKGLEEGSVGLYKNQPLALVNHGGSTSKQIKTLAQKIQKDVKNKTGLDIDFEVVEW